jgi:hypothetical protein
MRTHKTRKGQALVLVTLSLIAMCGMMGLAVDLGWSFYVHKTARAATDAAALAGAKSEFAEVQQPGSGIDPNGPYRCGAYPGNVRCTPLAPCSNFSGDNGPLGIACRYAVQNGFQNNGHGNRQNLMIEADVGDPRGAEGVTSLYWVHVIAAESVPQLFSAVLGNTDGVVSADSIAVITTTAITSSVNLLNRSNDPEIPQQSGSPPSSGSDVYLSGSPTLNAGAGITIASESLGAGVLSPGAAVNAPFTLVARGGSVGWTPFTSLPLGSNVFGDPESGKGQPPLIIPASGVPRQFAVPGGNLNCSAGCSSATYYASVSPDDSTPTGRPIKITGGSFADGTFGLFTFVGGANITGDVTFGAGEYVMAGALNGNDVFNLNNANMAGSPTDAGRILILTGADYVANSLQDGVVSHMSDAVTLAALLQGLTLPPLNYGPAEYKCGSCTGVFTGLNSTPGSGLPAALEAFAPFAIWQDQQNSTVAYDSNGNVITGCGTPTCPGSNSPDNASRGSLTLWGGNNVGFNIIGALYQPRGAYTFIHSDSTLSGTAQLVTGGLDMQGSGGLNLLAPPIPLTKLIVTLIR